MSIYKWFVWCYIISTITTQTSCSPLTLSPFHPAPWLSYHDRLNSKDEKVRTQYEGVEGGESQWGVLRHNDAHGRTNFASKSWSWGDSHRVGTGDNGAAGELCVWPLQQHSPHHTITQAVDWSDISGNFHWCGTGAPAVKTEQRGGVGWGEMSRKERVALDVAYQTWQDLAALWLMGGNIDKFFLFLSFSVSVRYCFQW